MARHIPPPLAPDQTLIPANTADVPRSYFRIARLNLGERLEDRQIDFELLVVVLSGTVDITVGDQLFNEVGSRRTIWDGNADSVYAGTRAGVSVTARSDSAEIAIAGGYCPKPFAPFRIMPQDVESVLVGSVETHTQRTIRHILGQTASNRTGNLLVSELYAAPGCWSGYPPHKHDEEALPEESAFEEIYHYRFDPETGFGGQYHYRRNEEPTAVMTRHGSTFVVDDGYHPTSTSPGHRGYIFTILVGKHQPSLVQRFDPHHEHLMAGIPGLQAMRDMFR